jgi:uncharacterized membrane-anchored protein YhcB (DUF1043 family)
MFNRTAKLPSPPPPPPAPAAKDLRRWLPWAIPVLAFLIGIAVGHSGQESDPTATPQFQTLRTQLESSQQKADQLGDQVEEAKTQLQDTTSGADARLAEQAAELEQHKADLQQRRAEVEVRAKEVYAREKAVRAAEGQASEPAYDPAPAPAPVAEAPVSAYYQNCDAVRAAGAAPIRVGDPGYGGHLDRDGDGVGCE